MTPSRDREPTTRVMIRFETRNITSLLVAPNPKPAAPRPVSAKNTKFWEFLLLRDIRRTTPPRNTSSPIMNSKRTIKSLNLKNADTVNKEKHSRKTRYAYHPLFEMSGKPDTCKK